MHFVYVLKSLKTHKLYFGQTSDLKNRFIQHNKGKEKAIKYGIPRKLIYYEAYLSKRDALHRERQLKSFKSAYGFFKEKN